jgi:hypothetical protein
MHVIASFYPDLRIISIIGGKGAASTFETAPNLGENHFIFHRSTLSRKPMLVILGRFPKQLIFTSSNYLDNVTFE